MTEFPPVHVHFPDGTRRALPAHYETRRLSDRQKPPFTYEKLVPDPMDGWEFIEDAPSGQWYAQRWVAAVSFERVK